MDRQLAGRITQAGPWQHKRSKLDQQLLVKLQPELDCCTNCVKVDEVLQHMDHPQQQVKKASEIKRPWHLAEPTQDILHREAIYKQRC